jgi:predicted transcriptional regulator
MRYRSQSQIIQSILETAIESATKTKIMYASYLSYTQLKKYLSILTESGLIKESNNGLFIVTEKGKNYIKSAKTLAELIE